MASAAAHVLVVDHGTTALDVDLAPSLGGHSTVSEPARWTDGPLTGCPIDSDVDAGEAARHGGSASPFDHGRRAAWP